MNLQVEVHYQLECLHIHNNYGIHEHVQCRKKHIHVSHGYTNNDMPLQMCHGDTKGGFIFILIHVNNLFLSLLQTLYNVF